MHKFGTGNKFEALISNLNYKIRYEYVLSERKAIFCKNLKILLKYSLIKASPWQHPGLPSNENYFK